MGFGPIFNESFQPPNARSFGSISYDVAEPRPAGLFGPIGVEDLEIPALTSGTIGGASDDPVTPIPHALGGEANEPVTPIPQALGGAGDEPVVFIPQALGGGADDVLNYLTPQLLLRIDQARAPLIAVVRSVNMNSTSDQIIDLSPNKYIIRRVVVTNASVSLTTAVGGIYTGPGKTGTAVVPAGQTYAALTSHTKFLNTGQHISTITDAFVTDPLYFSLTTPQGVAATADIYIYGDSVEP